MNSYQMYITKDGNKGRIFQSNIFGEPVEKTRDEYPYCYDPYLIYGRSVSKEEKLTFVYSDRIPELRAITFTKAKDIKFVEEIFSKMFGEEIKIISIAEGANQYSGYPYLIYAFKVNN